MSNQKEKFYVGNLKPHPTFENVEIIYLDLTRLGQGKEFFWTSQDGKQMATLLLKQKRDESGWYLEIDTFKPNSGGSRAGRAAGQGGGGFSGNQRANQTQNSPQNTYQDPVSQPPVEEDDDLPF